MWNMARKLTHSRKIISWLRRRGFTVVELLMIVSIIAVLAIITVVVFSGMQRRSSESVVQSSVSNAQKVLQTYFAFNHYYPSNIADTEFTPPLSVPIAFYTDSPQTPVYPSLTSEQNAQLFLNSCNGFMPVTSGGTTYNTSCVYNGNNLHVAGTVASNVVIHGPTVQQSDIVLICGAACTTAQSSIVSTFLSQGGSFPITVPKNGASLPAPTLQTTGNASRYCLEGRSSSYSDIIYHMSPSSSTLESGPCPADAALHYP